jgi:phage terminase small subunit
MSELNARQRRAIPFIVSSPTVTEGVNKAGVNPKTFYQWLKQPEFKAELDRQRNEVAKAAFENLTQSLTKAVENLVGLLDNKNDRLKRLACEDVIEYILKHKEIEDLENRISAIEQRLS